MIADLTKQLAAALRRIEAQDLVIAELRERLNQNSQNSSKPPSSDPPSLPPKPPQAKTGRKPGGQPGHKGHQRMLLPVDERNVRNVVPAHCRGCGTRLKGVDSAPFRHQVVEVPEPKPEVHEWRLHSLQCGCGTTTRAELPAGVPRGNFGPRLVATTALLSGAYRLSKRLVVSILANLHGIPISPGSVTACERMASEAVSAPVEEAREYVKQQPVKHADESSWAEGPGRDTAWLWVATTPLVTVFLIWASRGKDVAQRMLGEVYGVLVSDRWCAYSWWPTKRRQLCWAHIKRHFQAMIDAGGEAAVIGESLQERRVRLFHHWGGVRDGTLSRASFRTYVSDIRCDIRTLMEQGRACNHKQTATTCRELLKLEAAMWTFARIEGVEPTNNHGERAIRPGVIWRKLSFGTHSQSGSRFVERILTVVYTLKQQKRNPLTFMFECVAARMNGNPTTESLLPSA